MIKSLHTLDLLVALLYNEEFSFSPKVCDDSFKMAVRIKLFLLSIWCFYGVNGSILLKRTEHLWLRMLCMSIYGSVAPKLFPIQQTKSWSTFRLVTVLTIVLTTCGLGQLGIKRRGGYIWMNTPQLILICPSHTMFRITIIDWIYLKKYIG